MSKDKYTDSDKNNENGISRRKFITQLIGTPLRAGVAVTTLAGLVAATPSLNNMAEQHRRDQKDENNAGQEIIRLNLVKEWNRGDWEKTTSTQFKARDVSHQVAFYTDLKNIIDDPSESNIKKIPELFEKNRDWIVHSKDSLGKRDSGPVIAKAIAYTLSTKHDKKTLKALIDTITNSMPFDPHRIYFNSTLLKPLSHQMARSNDTTIAILAQAGFGFYSPHSDEPTVIIPKSTLISAGPHATPEQALAYCKDTLTVVPNELNGHDR